MTTPLNCQVVIAGTDVSAHVVSVTRSVTLENPGATVQVEFGADFSASGYNPYDTFSLKENGVQTLTGFVTHILTGRQPAKKTIQAEDTYRRCKDYFIDSNLWTSGSAFGTIGYYVTYLCNLCGISFSINDTSGSNFALVSNVPLGLKSVADALVQLSAIAQWCMRVDPSGVLQFDHIARPTVPTYTLTTVESWEEELNDTDTKNAVKVWGFQGGALLGGSIIYNESRDVPGVPDTRTMVYGIPEITNTAQAKSVADAALDQWASLEHLGKPTLVGNPSIQVGQSIKFSDAFLSGGYFFDTVTDLKTRLDTTGYNQDLMAGRRAYRYPYWPVGTPPTSGSTSGSTPGTKLWETSGSGGYVQKIIANGSSLYLVGQFFDGSHDITRSVRIEKRNASDGSLVWSVDNTRPTGSYFSSDAVFDNYLYIAISSLTPGGLGVYVNIYKYDPASGVLLSTINLSTANLGRPPMAQNNTDLYVTNSYANVFKISKASFGVSHGYVTGSPLGLGVNSSFFAIYYYPGDGTNWLIKYDIATGANPIKSQVPRTAGEMSLVSQEAYILFSTGANGWAVGRYSVGAVYTDPISQDWFTPSPNSNNVAPHYAFPRGMSADGTVVVIGLAYLYTAYLSLADGSTLFEVADSTNSSDFLATCVQSGGVYYAAGQKNSQWYVQARLCP